MECNKDEAIRSRDIAEQKFLLHDLLGAKKSALKAERLFPGLEGLSQLLAVLDVHIVAQDKVNGVDANWYGILQTHATADDVTIKRQYRKLALILHPDKNRAVGAEGAFKLISEAWGVLSDKSKKAAHDARRAHTVRPADGFCNFSTKSWPQPMPVKKTPTFWILCPSCQKLVQCLRAQENSIVFCTACHQAFVATAVCNTSGNSFRRTTEYAKSRGKSNATSIPQDKPNGHRMGGSKSNATSIPQGKPSDGHHMGGLGSTQPPNKADDPCVDRSTSMPCGSDDHHMAASASLHCHSDDLHGNKKSNARPDEVNVKETGDASQQHSDRRADGMSTSSKFQEGQPNTYSSPSKARNTNLHSAFQFHMGSHRNRAAPNHSPAAVKATVETVQNAYETVKTDRVRAQKEAFDKAMKKRVEAHKEVRRQEHKEQWERKQRRKEEELKREAKAARHAKIAFEKLFARGHKPSV